MQPFSVPQSGIVQQAISATRIMDIYLNDELDRSNVTVNDQPQCQTQEYPAPITSPNVNLLDVLLPDTIMMMGLQPHGNDIFFTS